MESNSKKLGGFGLIEVVISMMIMGIISMSVYAGYIQSIKHTKDGQVKQEAALEGKKVIEEIKSTDIQLPVNLGDKLKIGNIELIKTDSSGIYTKFLNEKFEDISETSAKYAEVVTISQTKTNIGNINFTYNQGAQVNPTGINYTLNIIKESQSSGTIKDYISNGVKSSPELQDQDQDKIILSIYLEKPDANNRIVTIKDFKGVSILSSDNLKYSSGKINININFKYYKQIDSSIPKPVVINVYNLTTDIPNIFLEKSNEITADLEIFKGQMNLYDNRAENPSQASVGNLYNIKVELMDYKKYPEYKKTIVHDDNNNLFTGYYNQNIK